MVKRAIVTVRLPRLDGRDRPRALITVGGLSLLERQLRQLARLDVEQIWILANGFALEIESALTKMRKIPGQVDLIQNPKELVGLARAGDDLLFLDDALLIDDRILASIIQSEAACILAVDPRGIGKGMRSSENLLGVDDKETFAGIAKIPAALISAQAPNAPAEDFLTLLVQAAYFEDGRSLFDIASVSLYLPDIKRNAPPILYRVSEREGADEATGDLISMAQKGVLDWPGRFIYPFFENTVTKVLLDSAVTPHHMKLVNIVFGFVGTYLFAIGQMIPALVLALIFGLLDGVDGKLARVKMLTSRLGSLTPIGNRIVEFSWYFGIAFALFREGSDGTIFALPLLIILSAGSELASGEFYRRISGVHLDDRGSFERKLRLIGGRRNCFVWALIPFAVFNLWLMAMWFLAGYAILSAIATQWRFVVRMMEFTSNLSPIIARNFRNSTYFSDHWK